MRALHFSTLLVVAAAATVQAANPRIIIKNDPPNPTVIVDTAFNFQANGLGGGDFSFQNGTGQDWKDLTINATLAPQTAITCGPGPFETCTISEKPMGTFSNYTIMFGPTLTGGIVDGELFSINLNDQGDDPNGSGSWAANRSFAAQVNTTPEPSAALLVGLGAAAVGGIYRRQRRQARP